MTFANEMFAHLSTGIERPVAVARTVYDLGEMLIKMTSVLGLSEGKRPANHYRTQSKVLHNLWEISHQMQL